MLQNAPWLSSFSLTAARELLEFASREDCVQTVQEDAYKGVNGLVTEKPFVTQGQPGNENH